MNARIYVSMTVSTEDQTLATRAVEAMSRCATGLALEGILASISVGPYDDSDDDT